MNHFFGWFAATITTVVAIGFASCGGEAANGRSATGGETGTTGGITTSGGTASGGAAGGTTPSGGTASGGASTGGESSGGSGGSDTYCDAPSDCGWGEIDHDIVQRSDCLCLFGCPYLPLRQDTIARRLEQYQRLCDPNVDGQGNPCPIDDCASPPSPTCEANVCGPADPWH